MSVIGTLRDPEHTGDRRCIPCTLVNLALLWIAVNGLVLLWSPPVGGVALVVGLCVIWLRGYLVPFTPTFGPKLVELLPVPTTWFHDTHDTGSLAPDTDDGDRLLARLADAGVLAVDGEQLYLDQSFERRWHDEMDRLAALSLQSLAEQLEELPGLSSARAYEQDGKQWIVVGGQQSLVPRHVAVAELGAVRALEPTFDVPQERRAMARPLREFLTDCPVCAVPFERGTEVSCCGGHTNPAETPRETLVCPECQQQFLVLPAPAES